MTIKQNGGVFGRNPTFNDVTIEGELTFNGDIDVGSDLKVDGDLEVTGTIAVGNSSAGAKIDVSTGAGEYALRLENGSGAYFRVKDGGLTEVGGNVKFTNAGSGIDFSATAGTGTSELFDDYEEGTWTPTYLGSTGDPTITYDMQYGIYVKVGRLCQAMLRIRTDAVSGGSGNLRIGGLPFSAFSAPTSSMSGGITVNRADSFTTNTPAFGVISNGNDYIDLNYDLAANAVTTANLTNAANSNTAIISLMYQTA
jgi:hypothetical protein